MSRLLDFYKSVLKFSGMVTDDDGFVYVEIGSNKEPAMVDRVRMVIPTLNQLKADKPSERIVFHPLKENIFKGESTVLSHFRKSINIKLNYAIAMVASELLGIAASPALHKNLNPIQSKLLAALGEVHENAPTAFMNAMLSAIKDSKNNSAKLYTNIFLTRGVKVANVMYSRVGVVDWPFYNELNKTAEAKFTSSASEREKKAFKAVLEFMFPDIEVPESYNYGTNSDIATWFCSLMGTAIKIASRLNDIIENYGEHFTGNVDKIKFDVEWYDVFSNLKGIEAEIEGTPMQPGNEGSGKVADLMATAIAAPEITRSSTLPTSTTQAPVHAAPVAINPHAPTVHQPLIPVQQNPSNQLARTSRGIDIRSFNNAMSGMQTMQPALQVQQPAIQIIPGNNMMANIPLPSGFGGNNMIMTNNVQVSRPPKWSQGDPALNVVNNGISNHIYRI